MSDHDVWLAAAVLLFLTVLCLPLLLVKALDIPDAEDDRDDDDIPWWRAMK